MIFVKVNEKNEVFHIRYNYTYEMTEIDTSEGMIFDDLPTEEVIEGKYSILLYDPDNMNLYYKYEVVKPTEEETLIQTLQERIAKLEEDNAQLTYALMMGGLL